MGCFGAMRQSRTGIWRRLGFRGWAALIVGVTMLAAVLAVTAVVALGILLFLLPAAAVAGAISLFLASKSRRDPARGSVSVIEGEFRVVDPDAKPDDQT
jgi:hypothetical protein